MVEDSELFIPLDISRGGKIEIKQGDNVGRFIVAKRDLCIGEVILRERPLSLAPMLQTHPVCLACLKDVDGSFLCNLCGWPMCSRNCSQADIHAGQECRVFQEAGVKVSTTKWEFTGRQQQPLYDIITFLRISCLRGGQEEEVYRRMQDHLGAWLAKEQVFKERFRNVISYVKNMLKMSVSEEDIYRVYAVSFTNDFSHMGNNEMRVMFPLTALLNHSCCPNITRITTEKSGSIEMIVRANRPIKAGEEIFNTYIDIMEPSVVRRNHLFETKLMNCRCERCVDPTDLGTGGNSVVCPFCQGQNCRQEKQQLEKRVRDEKEWNELCWKCQDCDKFVSATKVEDLILRISAEQKKLLNNPENKTVNKLEKFIEKWSNRLHSKNMLLIRVKYNLIGLYTRQPGYTVQEMSESKWVKKRELCQEIMEVLKVLEPGLTLRLARIMYELYLPLAMLAQLHLNQGTNKAIVKQEYQKSVVMLKLAIKIFSEEEDDSWERKIAESGKDTVHQLQDIIKSL